MLRQYCGFRVGSEAGSNSGADSVSEMIVTSDPDRE
jgi:hypothetical protein